MKVTFYISIILIVLSCTNKVEKKNGWKIEDLTDEEVNFIIGVFEQEKECEEYDRKEKSILGLTNLEKTTNTINSR